MDIDDNASHVEGSTTVMSAGESESESENDIVEVEPDVAETPYIVTPEDEFGAVSCHSFRCVKHSHEAFVTFKVLLTLPVNDSYL